MKLGYKVVQVSTLVHTTIICLPDFARGSELVPLFPDFHPCSVFPAQHPQRSYYSADAPNPPFSYCKRRSFSGDLEAPFLTHFLSDPFGVLIFGLFLLSSLSGILFPQSPHGSLKFIYGLVDFTQAYITYI